MRLGVAIRWTLALVLAVVLHLAVLNIAPRREPVIQIEGGALQVQLGLDVATEASTAGGAVEPPPALVEPELAPESEPAAPQDNALIPTEIEPEPRSDPEPEPEPDPDPVEDPPVADPPEDPPAEETEDATSADADETEQVAEPAPQEGDAAADSAQADAGSEGSARPSTAPGNAASANYAGEVMSHLSRIRRPRASSPGSTMVAFTVALDGSLDRLEVQRSSGSRRFDREALRMVERGAPFPRPPAGVNRDFVVEIEGQ